MTTLASCPSPFVAELPEIGGDVEGRFCSPVPGAGVCCLPCPKQNFFYPDSFSHAIHAMTFLSLASVIACAFLLLSFAVLSTEYTNRHYLSVCLTFAIMLMEVSFVIPLGNPENQCYDAITPHDMYSSINCALSGAFLLGGGWCTMMWVFLRTLSLHLQICWQMVPGRRFFLSAQAIGWSIPVVALAIALSITGVSFRFGESCHINSHKGLQTFWGPLLGMAVASIVTQFTTFLYCVKVYIRSLLEDKPGTTQASAGSVLPYSQSIRTVTAAQALRRIRRVIALQWRGIAVVIIILTNTIYFSTIFLQFDNGTHKTPENLLLAKAWLTCVIKSGGAKEQCFAEAHKLVLGQEYAISVLFLLSCNGLWALLLLGRSTIYRGWVEFFRNLFKRKQQDEFISLNAARLSEQPMTSYEMLESKKGPNVTIRIPEQAAPTAANAIREYNPSTFSAQLRERADSNLSMTQPIYPPYTETYSHRPSPSGPPFSPFKDTPHSTTSSGTVSPVDNNTNSRSPIEHPQRRPSFPRTRRTESQTSISAGPFSPYADQEMSPQYPKSARMGPTIGFAQ